ncbi:MAG TPA: transglutaminase family protein [Candidatus Acidoferrales bacterium]|nr:transglutaminase family protein [Candidatus Acidoferrales bacterium]
MKTYTVAHRTTYRYQSDVAYSRLIAHLGPRPTTRQKTLAFEVNVTPEPFERFERSDFFGNTTDWFTIDEPHDVLDVTAESQVTVEATPTYDPNLSSSWETVRKSFEFSTDPQTLEAVQYTFDTPLTATNSEVVAYARKSFARGRPLLACVEELNTRVHADFKYDKKATDTRTTVPRAFELRAGVCQDLAHVSLACVRAMGLAARYVSGYLLTRPPAGGERLVGADASHAWFAVWIPPFGWVDFDPTNDMLPSSHHITVAWGRDYVDVAPIHGIITGGSEHKVDVAVDVVPR